MQQVGSCKTGTSVQDPLAVPDQQLTVDACIAFQILARAVQGHLARRLQDYFTMVIPVERTVQPVGIFPGLPPGPMTTRAREGIHNGKSSALAPALALRGFSPKQGMSFWLGP